MNVQELIAGIDEEIDRLKQVKTLLAGHGVGVGNGQPRRKKRVLSADARARIAAAQRKRWAKQKAARR